LSWYPFHNLFGSSEEGTWVDSILNVLFFFSSGNLQSRCGILSITLSGSSRKGFGISLTLSFGNPQPGGFNPLYPFHDPFGLFEERNQADSSPHPSGNPQPSGFFPLNPCHDPFGLFEERIRADSSLSIPTITLSSRSRGGVRWTLM
jgi:hypothetical protein